MLENDNNEDLFEALKRLVERTVTSYSTNPVIRNALTATKTGLLLSSHPEVGVIVTGLDELIVNHASPIIQKRKITYLYESAKRGIREGDLKDEDSLHIFLMGYFRASKTHTEQKIKRIARLVSGSIKENMDVAIFEEYLAILSAVTEIQLQVLLLLTEYEKKYYLDKKAYRNWIKENPKVKEKERIYRATVVDKFWDDFEKTAEVKFKLTLDELYFILQKVSNLGLYLAFGKPTYNAAPRSLFLRGQTTNIFADFVQWIQLQDEIFP